MSRQVFFFLKQGGVLNALNLNATKKIKNKNKNNAI